MSIKICGGLYTDEFCLQVQTPPEYLHLQSPAMTNKSANSL